MRLICGLVRLDGTAADQPTLDAMIDAMTSEGLSPRIARRIEGAAAFAVLDFAARDANSNIDTDADADADGTWIAADLRPDRPEDIAAAFQRWDVDLPDRLDGDFAIAAWTPARQRLVCARDIMGVRPLCYAHIEGRFLAFASLPKGLHASGLVARRLDRVEIGRLAAELFVRGRRTGFQDILWLEAGHSLVLEQGELHLHRAWRPDPARVGTWRGTAEEAASKLRTLVEEAVRCRLPSTGPVATHLSGGLDSSAITVIAARAMRASQRPLHAFSMLADPARAPGALDESAYVKAVREQEPDLVWQAVHFPPIDTDDGMTDPDLPLSGSSVTPEEQVCAAARQAGSDILLSGAGGDETATYNGHAIYAALLKQRRWRALQTELRAQARRTGQSLAWTAARRLLAPLLPPSLLALRRRVRGLPVAASADQLEFLSADLRTRVEDVLVPRSIDNSPRGRIAALTESYVVGRCVWGAITGARHGIAFTYPLLDRRIIEFVLSLPLEHFVSQGWTRQPYRSAMKGILPETIRLRETKFLAFPDLPIVLATAKSTLLQHARRLQHEPAIARDFDLDRIVSAIDAAPDGDDAVAAAHAANRGGTGDRRFVRAMHALRALRLARHISRFG